MSDPITPLRLSEINVDRLNRMLVQLHQQMQGLSDRIAKLEGKPAITAGKNDYPGIEAGSKAIIGGPPQGGPLPLQPWIDDHSLVIGEGSKPMKWIKGTDGQVPIACSGDDPKFGNIKGQINITGPYGFLIQGTTVVNQCNSIDIGLTQDIVLWVRLVSTILSILSPLL